MNGELRAALYRSAALADLRLLGSGVGRLHGEQSITKRLSPEKLAGLQKASSQSFETIWMGLAGLYRTFAAIRALMSEVDTWWLWLLAAAAQFAARRPSATRAHAARSLIVRTPCSRGADWSAQQQRGVTVEFVAWTQFDAPLLDLDGVLTPTADLHMRALAELVTA